LCALRSQRAFTLYPATDCAAATDISGVTGCWQLSRQVQGNMREGGWERAELLAAYRLSVIRCLSWLQPLEPS